MSDLASQLSAEEMQELCALADGTLSADRRAAVEARVAASPELAELLERQRQALAATRALAAEEVPVPLRAAVEARRRALSSHGARRWRLAPRLALAGAAAVAGAVIAAVVLSGGPGAPSVAEAARLADGPPNVAAPPPARAGSTRLALAVEGVAFPNFAQWSGWRALGARRGTVDGRDVTAVFYGKAGRRIAYVIVSGSELGRASGGRTTLRQGVGYQTLTLDGRLAVTWRRGGHTCVLLGRASRAELLELASWQLTEPR
ncbi:MAG TPA: hypothetical protein VFB35_01225 [Gaiellaceae bacterium]|nr:hypothetical protein [Gaiellaceae bacterium]